MINFYDKFGVTEEEFFKGIKQRREDYIYRMDTDPVLKAFILGIGDDDPHDDCSHWVGKLK